MVNISNPVTSDITMAKIEIFATPGQRTGQILAYPTKYLGEYWLYLHQNFSIGKCVYGDYYVDKSFAIARGTLQWQ